MARCRGLAASIHGVHALPTELPRRPNARASSLEVSLETLRTIFDVFVIMNAVHV